MAVGVGVVVSSAKFEKSKRKFDRKNNIKHSKYTGLLGTININGLTYVSDSIHIFLLGKLSSVYILNDLEHMRRI